MRRSIRSVSSASSLSLASSSPPSSPDTSALDGSIADLPSLSLEDHKEYVMVIGGLGYIGSHTTLELLKAGYNVVVVDNLSNAFESARWKIEKLAKQYCSEAGIDMPILKFHKLDYRSSAMRALLGRYTIENTEFSESRLSRITGVIHFAAYKSVEESIHKPLDYYLNNICGLVELLVALGDHGINNFVFSSSATVYGVKANEGKPLKEDDLVHFPETCTDEDGTESELVPGAKGLTSPYGRTKYFAEAILADVAKADPSRRITALRYFNPVGCHPSGILGEDPRQTPTNLFPVIAQVLTGSRPMLDVFGSDWDTTDGTAVRDFIHVVDLARGHIAALAAASKRPQSQPFRAYNLGTGNGSTVAEVIESMQHASGQQLPVRRAGRRAGDVGFCVAATARAEQELGWKTEKSLDECAADTWRSLQTTKA